MGKYKLVKTIGKGNFAKVKLAKHMPTGHEVCYLHVHVHASTTNHRASILAAVHVLHVQYVLKKERYQFRFVPFHFVPFSTNRTEWYHRAYAINRSRTILCIELSRLCLHTLSRAYQ